MHLVTASEIGGLCYLIRHNNEESLYKARSNGMFMREGHTTVSLRIII